MAWRPQERALRERLAELQARSGNWRAALSLLRDTEALFPDGRRPFAASLHEMFTALLRSDVGTLPPLELAAGRGER